MFSEEFVPLNPVHFFQLTWDCPQGSDGLEKKKYRLPSTDPWTGEEIFAQVAMGWGGEGLHFAIDVDQKFQEAFYPEVSRGDSVELLIDTRDVKTSGYNTRFCHYFFFLPVDVDGHQKGEITRFRTEDAHPLCEAKELKLQVQTGRSSYHMKIFIPSSCLNGYDPEQCNHIGFTYRINRYGGEPQHLSVLSQEFGMEQQPSLWSSVRLMT